LVDDRLLPGIALDQLSVLERERVLERHLAALLDDGVGRPRGSLLLGRPLLRSRGRGEQDRRCEQRDGSGAGFHVELSLWASRAANSAASRFLSILPLSVNGSSSFAANHHSRGTL